MGDKVGENPAALRAAVFLLSAKNRREGVQTPPPPSRAKVKCMYIPISSSRGKLHARFFREALAQSGAKRQGGSYQPPTPCAVEGCEMACAGEG